MAKEIIKDTIAVGDLVSVSCEVYESALKTGRDCRQCCDLYHDGRCRGLCYRWQRDDIVFHYLCDEWSLPKTAKIVTTGMWETVADRLAELQKRADQLRAKINYLRKKNNG